MLSSTSLTWCQAPGSGSAAAPVTVQYEEQRMSIPSPVSDNGYSLSLSDEPSAASYISGGASFGGSHDDNVLSTSSSPIADSDYYISPWISLTQSSTRAQWSLEYNPKSTMYQHATSLNRTDHDLNAQFEYRITPYASIRFEDNFNKSSNLFDQIGGSAAPGSLNLTQYTSLSIIPVADIVTNRASLEAGYQFGRNDMVGAGFRQFDLRYPNLSQMAGLYNSSSQTGEAFYSHRISSAGYIGALYRYEKLSAFPGNSETDVEDILLFYSATLFRRLSLSASAGPEHSTTYQPIYEFTTEPLTTWSPAIGIGLRWQGDRTGIAANFTKRVQGGGGLIGAVRANAIDVSTRYQLSRLMSVQIAVAYSDNTLLDWNPLATGTSSGHGFLASTSLERHLREHFTLQIGYGREEQRYAWVPVSSGIATRNRSWISLSYQFERPLGGS